ADQSFATIKYSVRRMYYGALILVSCDIPARNKICGFSSHSSKHACFKYKKPFKTNETSDQSNIDNYNLRTIEEHKIIAEKWKYSVSSKHKQLFDQYAYKMMKIWTIETNLISKNQLINIQNIVNNSLPPANIRRIPHKIASKFQKLYGSNIITPNIHYHLHLKDDMLNYGSWYNYWCYAYERLNRQIASFYTFERTVELDMLNYINQQIEIYRLLDQIKSILTSTAQASLDYLQNKQLEKETLTIYNYTIPKIIEFQYSITNINYFVTGSEDYPGRLIKSFSEAYLSNKNLKLLVDYYTEIYSNDNLKFYTEGQVSNVSNSYLVSKRIIKA
ncbi:21263_t:CDS:2, partial [Racocetra persica]